MLNLSHTTGYAIKALGCLNGPNLRPQLIAEVAECAGVPKPYLAKIINSLVHSGLVYAKRGHNGGISLARPADAISLLEVVEAVEGKDWIGKCLLGLDVCSGHRKCPTHDLWVRFRHEVVERLRATSVAEVVDLHRPGCPIVTGGDGVGATSNPEVAHARGS